MANISTSPQVVGSNLGNTMNTRLYAWYDGQSGNTCTVHVRLTVVNTGANYTGTNKSYFIQIGGYNSGVQSWTYTPLNTNQEYTVAEATQTYSGGDAISASAGYWTYNYGSADIGAISGWYVPTFYSPPTGLSTQLREVYPNGAKIYVSVSSYGNPSSASGRYVEAAILGTSTYGNPYKYLIASNTPASNIVVNNSGPGSLTIQPNTQYYYGGYANNTQRSASTVTGQLVTAPPTPTVSLGTVKSSVVTVDYSIPADGGFYTKTFEYSIDGGTTWETVGTIPSTATTGSFTINGLTPNTSYTIKTRTSTTAANTYGTDLTLVTPNGSPLYGSVNSEATRITKLYGSVNGQTKRIKKLYGSDNGQTVRII